MDIEQHNIDTISEYVNLIDNECVDEGILFRGQPQDKPLVPRIARVKFNTDLSLEKAEQRIFEEFKRKSLPFLEFTSIPKSDWDWLALMQHYGLATRLLDWTYNPLAALWFAVKAPSKNKGRGVVWIFTPESKDIAVPSESASPFTVVRTKVFVPNHITRRIVAQSGCFTVHKYLAKEKRFIPLEKNIQYKSKLIKCTIPALCFSDLRYELDRFGINSASMFPELGGLGEYIQWSHTLLDDEKM